MPGLDRNDELRDTAPEVRFTGPWRYIIWMAMFTAVVLALAGPIAPPASIAGRVRVSMRGHRSGSGHREAEQVRWSSVRTRVSIGSSTSASASLPAPAALSAHTRPTPLGPDQQHQYSQHKVLTLETTGMKHMKTAAATTSKGPAVHQGGTPLGADCASQISDFFPR